MRPILAIVIAAAIIFGVQSFISANAGKSVERAIVTETEVEGEFSLELLLTFDAGPDPFSLDAHDAPSVLIERRGKDVLRRTDTIYAGKPILVEAPDIVEGANEFYVLSNPADDDPDAVRAVRVRILRDGNIIGEEWLASEPGLAPEGTLFINIPEAAHTDSPS